MGYEWGKDILKSGRIWCEPRGIVAQQDVNKEKCMEAGNDAEKPATKE